MPKRKRSGKSGMPASKRARGGRQKALIMALNYKGTRNELRGCENDGKSMKKLLKSRFGYSDRDITTVFDEGFSRKRNIYYYLRRHFGGARSGDHFFVHYSGHGTYSYDRDGDEEDGRDEALCDVNGSTCTDDQIYHLLSSLPEGVTVTFVMDCCHSGTIVDLDKVMRNGRTYVARSHRRPLKANVVIISGCMDDQTSADAYIRERNDFYGALSSTIFSVDKDTPLNRLTWSSFMIKTRRSLRNDRYEQIPQLSSTTYSKVYENVRF